MPEANRTSVGLCVHSLTPDVALLVWEGTMGGVRGRLPRATVGGRPTMPPHAHICVALGSAHRRNIMVVRADAAAVRQERLCIAEADGAIIAVADAGDRPAERPTAFAPADLVAGVDAAGRLRIARLMLEIVPGIFRLGDNPAFAVACIRLAAALAPMPPALLPCSRLFANWRLFACMAGAAAGENPTAVVISGGRVRRAPFAPAFANDGRDGSSGQLYLAMRNTKARHPDTVVVFLSDRGMICRRIATSERTVPAAITWFRGSGSAKAGPTVRRYVLDCLAHLGRHDVQAAYLLRELQALPPRIGGGSARVPIAAGADFIVANGAGVFVKGWLADPLGLAEAICIERHQAEHRIDIRSLIRFPHRANPVGRAAADRADATAPLLHGFALFAANDAHADAGAPCRISLCLRSGAAFTFAEGPSVMPPDQARDAILAAIPMPYLSREIIAEWIEPSVLAAHDEDQAAAAGAGSYDVIDIGRVPRTPELAVIGPMPDDPFLMRCRAGLFAAEPGMRAVEVLYILDRAQDQHEITRFLRGLHAAYGVAARLVMVPHARTAAAALNAGVQVSRAPVVVVVDRAVLPERPTWLGALTRHLRRRADVGIVAARLLREDHALWNDGLGIGSDRDVWDIRPIRAGFPRGFAAASRLRQVTGVSPGCIAIPRSVLERCGGFSQRYLSSDYSVADLCLTAAAAGLRTCLTTEPALFRLDPPGDKRLGREALDLDPRAEIDRRLLERRWRTRLGVGANARGGRAA